MNNKASKRLLAASVASLMLVVAFCGFTYAGDDADATRDGTTADKAYLKEVVVATADDTNGIQDENDNFTIVTTQYINAGSGITHEDIWWVDATGNGHNFVEDGSINQGDVVLTGHTRTIENSSSIGIFDLSVSSSGNVHNFTVSGKSTVTTETAHLIYVLKSTVDGKTITQTIFYDIKVKVVPALPESSDNSIAMTGYVGVGYFNKVVYGDEDGDGEEDKGWLNFNPAGNGLMFYANSLPVGLSMNIDGTITGVPTVAVTNHQSDVYVYNGTKHVSTYKLLWNVYDNVANITNLKVTGGDIVKVTDGRYLVKEGTTITVEGTVTGNGYGTLNVNGDPVSLTNDHKFSAGIYISGTGEKEIVISYTCDLDGNVLGESFTVTLEQIITVVSVDVVNDATTGLGITSGVTFDQSSQSSQP